MKPLLAAVLAFALCVSPLVAADAPRAVPAEVAKLLGELAQAEPAAVIAKIAAYQGPEHPLIVLSRAQAHWRLAQEGAAVAGTAKAPDRAQVDAAQADFAAALKLDATLSQAHLGLAQCAAAREDWLTASREAAAGVDPGSADAGLLTFLAGAALRAGDWRLATLAAQAGILRFPDSAPLRRIELTVLVNAGRGEDARQAVLALLAQAPGDVELWRQLAWSTQQTGREDEALAAVEAALALSPGDRGLRRQLAEGQLARGLPQAALITVRPLLGNPPAPAALTDEGLLLAATRAAADGGDLPQARAWLAAVPEAGRTRALRLQDARLAVRAGDGAAAGAALDALIAGGEKDPVVLTWAGALAEGRGEAARAEMIYLQASREDTAAGAATLRLAALYLRQERRAEAASVLATYLAKRPDDAQARALQAQLERRR